MILTHTLILCSHVLIPEDKAIITFFTFSCAVNWFITTFLAVCNLGQCFTCWKWQSMTLLDWWCDMHLEDYIRQHWLFMSYVPVHSPFSFLPNPAEQVMQEVAEEQTSQLLGHALWEIKLCMNYVIKSFRKVCIFNHCFICCLTQSNKSNIK